MKKKIVGILVCMLLIGTVLPVSGTVLMERTSISTLFGNTLYVGGSGPGNYSTIQEAIDNASDGDTVFVYNGTYDFTRINIGKSINLIGENKHNTIINGIGIGIIEITVSEVHVSSFTIQNSVIFILSDNSTISGNIFKSDDAIGLGIQISKAYNTISHNIFLNCGLLTDGSFHNSVYNNTVNGKPLVYLEDESDIVVDDAGQVILVDCENINIEGFEKPFIETSLYS